jgi:hypothetical protein
VCAFVGSGDSQLCVVVGRGGCQCLVDPSQPENAYRRSKGLCIREPARERLLDAELGCDFVHRSAHALCLYVPLRSVVLTSVNGLPLGWWDGVFGNRILLWPAIGPNPTSASLKLFKSVSL